MRLRERYVVWPTIWAIVLTTFLAGLSAGCAGNAPPDLDPTLLPLWQANEATLAVNTGQRAAIGLNAIPRCDTATPPVCAPLLSDDNTEVVVDAAAVFYNVVEKVPDGWRAAALTFADEVDAKLDAAGLARFKAYVQIVRSLLTGVGEK